AVRLRVHPESVQKADCSHLGGNRRLTSWNWPVLPIAQEINALRCQRHPHQTLNETWQQADSRVTNVGQASSKTDSLPECRLKASYLLQAFLNSVKLLQPSRKIL